MHFEYQRVSIGWRQNSGCAHYDTHANICHVLSLAPYFFCFSSPQLLPFIDYFFLHFLLNIFVVDRRDARGCL